MNHHKQDKGERGGWVPILRRESNGTGTREAERDSVYLNSCIHEGIRDTVREVTMRETHI